MVNTHWLDWCRLCASATDSDNKLIFKFELSNAANIINKHFEFCITPFDSKPTNICDNCNMFLISLKKFANRCKQVDLMYTEIIDCKREGLDLGGNFIQDLRSRFCFNFDENIEFSNSEESKSNYLNVIETIEILPTDSSLDVFVRKNVQHSFQEKSSNSSQNSEQSAITEKDIKYEIDVHVESENAIKENQLIKKNDDEISMLDEENENANESLENFMDQSFLNEYDNPKLENINLEQTNDERRRQRRRKEQDGLYKCDLCDKVFLKRPSYRCHVKTKHSSIQLFCSKCPKSFTSKIALRVHEKIHLPDEFKLVYPCQFCDKKFSKAVNAKTHMAAVHNNERSFICDECGKGFKTKGALQSHQLSHTNNRPFSCTECKKQFKSIVSLKNHSDQHSATTYPCAICGTIFNTKKSLKSHLVVHTDEKKYKCNICGNEYKRLKALKYHLISHTGFRHVCPFCDKTFADRPNWRNHQKSIHPNEYSKSFSVTDDISTSNETDPINKDLK